jgi:O-antigen/teichoic acid export membrane protein
VSEPLTPPPVEPLASWRQLMKSFGWLVLGEGFARLFGFVAVVLMARRLDPDGFGLVTLGATLVIWFGIVVDSGTEVLNVRDIARRPDRFKEIAEPVLGLRLALSAGAAVLLCIAAFFASSATSDRIVLGLFALWLPMIAINLRWMVLPLGKARTVAAGNATGQLLFAVGVVLFVLDVGNTIEVPLLQAAGEAVYATIVLVAVGRRIGLVRPRIDVAKWRGTLRESGPLMANQLSRAAVYSLSFLIVAIALGRADVGFLGAAYKPVLFFSGAMGLFYVSFLSSFSALDPEHQKSLFRRTALAAGGATVPLALAMCLSASFLVTTIYGDQYDNAIPVLAVLVWVIPILALNGPYGNALIAGHQQKVLMRNNLIGAGFNIVANCIAVPLWGITGVAVVAVLSEGLILTLMHHSAVRLGVAPSLSVMLGREPVHAAPPAPAPPPAAAPPAAPPARREPSTTRS